MKNANIQTKYDRRYEPNMEVSWILLLLSLQFTGSLCQIQTAITNNHNANCERLIKIDQTEYQCPPGSHIIDYQGLVIHVKKECIEIQCHGLVYLDVSTIPMVNATSNKCMEIYHCPEIRNGTIKDLMDKFTMNEIKQLKFNFIDNQNVTIGQHYFKGLTSLKTLWMSSRKASKCITDDVFVDMPGLEDIKLQCGFNISLGPRIFTSLQSTTVLDLSENSITELPDDLFKNMSSLTTLSLWGNKLRKIDKTSFAGLKNVTVLKLSINEIDTISGQAFINMPKLKILTLDGNELRDLPKELFSKNEELEQIWLRNNPLSSLPDFIFANLTKLKKVVLSKCNLTSLNPNVFYRSDAIEVLKLDANSLEGLSAKMFADLKSLKELDLSQNKLVRLELHAPAIEMLNLQRNFLEIIEENTFKDLVNLIDLNLAHNRISVVHKNAFSKAYKLERINFAHNNYNLNESLFKTCVELKHIDFSHNVVDLLPGDLIFNKPKLKTVSFRYNFIGSVHLNLLQTISQDEVTIDLTHNDIRWIDINLETYNNLTVPVVKLGNNPIECDCHLNRIVQRIETVFKNPLIALQNASCARPENIQGIRLLDLKSEFLTCDVEEMDNQYRCPRGCVCKWRPFDSSIVLNCSYGNLTAIPEIPATRILSEYYNQTHVFLQGNNIRDGPVAGMDGWENVTTLNLSQNQIESLHWLPPKLQVLILNNNNLTRMSHMILQRLNKSNIAHLDLGSNPWICDCEAQNLTNFVREHSALIDTKNMRCGDDGKLLIEMNKHNLCKQWQTVHFAFFIVFPFLILAILSALYYKYRENIKVWLYANNLCLWWVTEEELDKHKTYDAFVCYSHKDNAFVADKLKPVLEGEPHPYKLCIHERDWRGGELISDQIFRSVNESRRTIVILSANFLDSVWGIIEFKTAHIQAMKEGRARVIVILFDDVNINELDDQLKSYLNTNTYIKWNDPWFWRKLQYAMPHAQFDKRKHEKIMKKIDESFGIKPINLEAISNS